MNCCGNCINDEFLTERISQIGAAGDCSICSSSNVYCVDAESLQTYFAILLDLYKEVRSGEEGEPLLALLRSDWEIFNTISDEKAIELLKIFGDDSEIHQKTFKSVKVISTTKALELWTHFREELMHKNRFFPESKAQLEEKKHLLPYLIKKMSGSFFRARICNLNTPIELQNMGKPPSLEARNGRANPFGISYLYLASNTDTAICEVRPHIGDLIAVAEFELAHELTLVDLRNPRKTISPFSFDDEEILASLLNSIEFLSHLGQELSRPISQRDADLKYLSTQFLCEYIKHLQYDGVIYKSSINPNGFNIAIFNSDNTIPKSVKHYNLDRIEHTFSEKNF